MTPAEAFAAAIKAQNKPQAQTLPVVRNVFGHVVGVWTGKVVSK